MRYRPLEVQFQNHSKEMISSSNFHMTTRSKDVRVDNTYKTLQEQSDSLSMCQDYSGLSRKEHSTNQC